MNEILTKVFGNEPGFDFFFRVFKDYPYLELENYNPCRYINDKNTFCTPLFKYAKIIFDFFFMQITGEKPEELADRYREKYIVLPAEELEDAMKDDIAKLTTRCTAYIKRWLPYMNYIPLLQVQKNVVKKEWVIEYDFDKYFYNFIQYDVQKNLFFYYGFNDLKGLDHCEVKPCEYYSPYCDYIPEQALRFREPLKIKNNLIKPLLPNQINSQIDPKYTIHQEN